MRILLIAGHGQGDSGAVSGAYQEASLTRELLDLLYPKLSLYADVDIFPVEKNMYKFLQKNSFDFKQYNYVLEMHFNACVNDIIGDGKTTGTEILVHNSENSVTVEKQIVENIGKIGFANRGVKHRSNLLNMNICKGKQGVSYALLETCFIDDIDDMKLYTANKDKVVSAIADGIINGFGLKKENRFTDIHECYGRKEINELADMGIVSGLGNGTFAPKVFVTREDMAIMIRRAIKYITGK